MSRNGRVAGFAAALAVAAGCAGAGGGEAQTPRSDAPARAAEGRAASLPPAGHGTLRQDDFTVSLRSGSLLIKVTPLEEGVIRLAAPDTYARLHALATSRRRAAAEAARTASPALFLVSFFSYDPDVPFQPEDVQLVQRGVLRPLGIVPITPGWGRQILRQQETQSAIYAFREDLDLELPLSVRYGIEESDAWGRVLPRLDAERARVRARAGG